MILPKAKAWRRSERLPSYFWVDAICINQEDIKEKTYQVCLMGQIYSDASLVISWVVTMAIWLSLSMLST